MYLLSVEKNRAITMLNKNNEAIHDKEEALSLMWKNFLNNKSTIPLVISNANLSEYKMLILRHTKPINDVLIALDQKEIHAQLKKAGFSADLHPLYHSDAELKHQSKFIIKGIKDNIGYQNLAALNALSKLGMFKNNVKHFHTAPGLNLLTDFNGSIIGLNQDKYKKIKNANQIVSAHTSYIPYKTNYTDPHDSCDQSEIPNLKTN